MKMDNCLHTLVFLLSVLSVLSDSKDGCDKYGEEGQNFTVPLNHTLQDSDTLKWKRGDTIMFYQKGKAIVTKPPERVEVYPNGSLKLTNLKKTDTGSYIPEVHNADGKAVDGLKSIKLCILDSVPEPKVKINCSKPSPTKVTFTCNVDKAQGLTFTWLKNKKPVVSEENEDKPHILTQTAEKVEGNLFECKVSSLASSKTSMAVKHECSSPNSVPEPKVEINCSKTSPTKVTFTCNVDKAEGLTFTWLKNKKAVVSEEKKDKPHILTQTAEDVEENLFQCKVSNLASSKTSKPVKHECSSPKLCDHYIWIMVGILGGGGGLVLLLIIIIIVCCVWARKKRSMKVKGIKSCGSVCVLDCEQD